MINISKVQGVIFDVDDTLLDNGPKDQPELWLHARSRLAAVYQVGQEHGITALQEVTVDQNKVAFTTAAGHSLQSAIWNIFYMQGMVKTPVIDPKNKELVDLVDEIATLKNDLHGPILEEFGTEIPGAASFIQQLAAYGLAKHMALATTAVNRDVDIFLTKYHLGQYFPSAHVITHDDVPREQLKPDPLCYILAFKSLRLPESARRQVLVIEDNPRCIESAKSTGFYTCAITTRYERDNPDLLAVEPDLVVDSYAELSELLGMAA